MLTFWLELSTLYFSIAISTNIYTDPEKTPPPPPPPPPPLIFLEKNTSE